MKLTDGFEELFREDAIQNVKVYGLEESIKRAKYPMSVDIDYLDAELTPGISKLAVAPRGSGHDNFLKGIIVQFDVKFTVKLWTEAERYHWFDFISSQSTMHRLTRFNLDKSYIRWVDPRVITIMKEKIAEYNTLTEQGKTEEAYEKFLEAIYTNPTGFQLTAGMTTNYQQLKTIYAQRKNHKLPEWRAFCRWIETLPHSDFITC